MKLEAQSKATHSGDLSAWRTWETRPRATSTSCTSTAPLSRTLAAALDSRMIVSSVRTCAYSENQYAAGHRPCVSCERLSVHVGHPAGQEVLQRRTHRCNHASMRAENEALCHARRTVTGSARTSDAPRSSA